MTTNRPLVLFSTLAVKAALDELLPAFTAETGVPIEPTFDPTTVLQQHIDDGAQPDVIIGVTEALLVLTDLTAVADESLVAIARTGVGIAVAHDAPQPPIGTVDELVAALLDARSVAYSRTGASGICFAKVLDRLGVADQVNQRATVVEKGFTAHAILDGRADLAVQQLSELKFVREVDVVGPLPDDVQHYTEFSAGIGAASTHPAAEQLIASLTSADASARYASAGLEPLQR